MSFLFACSSYGYAFCQTGNVYSDIACIKKEDNELRNKINSSYLKLEKLLKKEDKEELAKSHKAWIIYRDAQCKVLGVASEMSQGLGAELSQASCIFYFNKNRLDEINNTAKEIQDSR